VDKELPIAGKKARGYALVGKLSVAEIAQDSRLCRRLHSLIVVRAPPVFKCLRMAGLADAIVDKWHAIGAVSKYPFGP
jgi:hypothetical protein